MAYYLTFRWTLIILAAFVSMFTTVVVKWLVQDYWSIHLDSGLLFFVIWCLTLLGLIYEFPVPNYIKERLHSEVYSEKKNKVSD